MKQTFFILFYLFQTDDVTFMFRKRIDFLDIFIKKSCDCSPLAPFSQTSLAIRILKLN
jgi:hypothetical protein